MDKIGDEGLKKFLSSIKPPYLISRRPLQEILLDSMVSKAFLVGGKNASDHLALVKDGWVVFEGPAAFKNKPQGLRCIGLPMTLCALWTGSLAITGSSLVDWSSSLKSFSITADKTLHQWHKETRQGRFAAGEQLQVDRLVKAQLEFYHSEFRKLMPMDHKVASKSCAELMIRTRDKHTPAYYSSVPEFWEPHTAHVYEGLNLNPKERCPMCQATYFCGITFPKNLPQPSNWPAMGELGVPEGGHHGCCAEALVFVQSQVQNGVIFSENR